MGEVLEHEIKQHVGVLSQNTRTGWKKELCVVSWGGKPAKLEIRNWNKDYTKPGKGITLTVEEVTALKELLNEPIVL